MLDALTAAGLTPAEIAQAVYEYHTATVTAMHT